MQPTQNFEPGKTFKAVYCEKFSVPAARFDESLFWRAIRWYARPLVFVMKIGNANYFRPDYEFIRSVGSCEIMDDVRAEVAAFRWECGISSPLRRRLRLRVSTSRIAKLAKRLLRSDQSATASI
jgi:hypothetical protein